MTRRRSVWHMYILSVTRDNREVVLPDFALVTTDVNVNSSYIKSFAVDKLLAAAAPKP